jgi:DNA-directed RNA polymerase specialized sigma subunit
VSSRVELSLDQPAGDDRDLRLGDLVAAPRAREEPEDLLALPGLVARLPELEREVIVLRFFQDLDQYEIAYEIAARVGFSQMHVDPAIGVGDAGSRSLGLASRLSTSPNPS